MTKRYRTKQGDTIDLIAWRYYGRQDGKVVEKLLDANPKVAESGAFLPENQTINLPDIEVAESAKGVRLWD